MYEQNHSYNLKMPESDTWNNMSKISYFKKYFQKLESYLANPNIQKVKGTWGGAEVEKLKTGIK